MYILELQWYEIIGMLFTAGGGLTLLGLALVKWARFRSKDRADVEHKRAEARKILAETDVAVSTEAMRVVRDMREELAQERQTSEQLREKIESRDDELHKAKEALFKADVLTKQLREDINRKDELLQQKDIEIEQLYIRLQKCEDDRRRDRDKNRPPR